MITTLKVSAGFGDSLDVAYLRVKSLDETIIFDSIEVDIAGVGAVLYDRLVRTGTRAPLVPFHGMANYSAGLLKK